MAILNILEFPDPRLRTIAKPVDVVDDALRQLIDDMFETMYENNGVGLAAPQVGVRTGDGAAAVTRPATRAVHQGTIDGPRGHETTGKNYEKMWARGELNPHVR